jgi:predicted RNase H-like HicB family nuclease
MRQVIFLPDGVGGYVVEVPSLPGCRAKGKNLSEAVRNTRQAIYEHIDKLKAAGQPIPEAKMMDIPKAEGAINDKLLLREDVIQAAQEMFPNEDLQTILDVMNEYGKRPFEMDTERVQVAAVRLSEGDVDKLRQLVADAKRDYRDVLSWYAMKFGQYP